MTPARRWTRVVPTGQHGSSRIGPPEIACANRIVDHYGGEGDEKECAGIPNLTGEVLPLSDRQFNSRGIRGEQGQLPSRIEGAPYKLALEAGSAPLVQRLARRMSGFTLQTQSTYQEIVHGTTDGSALLFVPPLVRY